MTQESPLLATKLFIPSLRSGLVPRSHLLARLNQGLGGKLTLVSAPAGFGKTTLVGEWLQRVERPFAWLSLDEGDDDTARFLVYLAAALQRVNDGWARAIQTALHAPQSSPPQELLTTLINDIAASERGFVLALDDYHAISNATVHDMLAFLLDHLPPAMHLVLITRADPPLPLARLRARGQLTEIRADDLRFTAEEAASFLNQVMGLDLTRQQVATLEARTEGWVAGLQLAALSLQGLGLGEDVAGFIEAFAGSHRYVMDYLVEEVFNRQPPDVQQFLLQTSILGRLVGPLCDAVTGQDGGQTMLEWLDAANLFTVPLDRERRWYRYHHLFGDLLRDRLQKAQPEKVPDLHRRASEWYERGGFMEDAVHHALQTNDFELATSLMERVAFSLWRLSKERTLLSWMRTLPEELVRSQPSLSLHYAAALTVIGQLDDVEPWLRSVETQIRGKVSSPHFQALLGHAYRLRAYVARFMGTPAEAIALSQQALQHTPADRTDMRGVILLHVGHAHFLNGEAEAAEQALTKASVACRATGHPAAYLSSIHYLAQLRVLQGRLCEAMTIYRQAAQYVAGQDEPVFAGIEHVGVGDLLCERNDLEAAFNYIQAGLGLAEMGGDFVFMRDGYLARARLEQALGNYDEALAFVQKAEQVVRRHQSPWEMALVEAWRARLWLAQGNLAKATDWAGTCGLRPDDELRFVEELGHLRLAQVLLAQGEPGKARQLLARLLRAAESAGRMGRAIEILVWQALALQAEDRANQATQSLERALALAEPEGYVRTFLDAGPGMTALLRRALARGIAPGYVARLLAACDEPVPAQPLVEPLTPRELEVLRLISAGLRNQEIADQLVISLATVKRHISNIYGKLGVSHRTQAIAHARELGLLSSHPQSD